AELDPSLITKRKRMLDSVGHYSRPDIFTVLIDREARTQVRSKHASAPIAADTNEPAQIPDSTYDGNDRLPHRAPHEEAIPVV
ncbi:MAG TPA: hypothetical protein VGD78_05970, partial [Chthoniobacterales bacterium]